MHHHLQRKAWGVAAALAVALAAGAIDLRLGVTVTSETARRMTITNGASAASYTNALMLPEGPLLQLPEGFLLQP